MGRNQSACMHEAALDDFSMMSVLLYAWLPWITVRGLCRGNTCMPGYPGSKSGGCVGGTPFMRSTQPYYKWGVWGFVLFLVNFLLVLKGERRCFHGQEFQSCGEAHSISVQHVLWVSMYIHISFSLLCSYMNLAVQHFYSGSAHTCSTNRNVPILTANSNVTFLLVSLRCMGKQAEND